MGLSMKDIAKAANVSVATVSNTISGKKYVSPELRERVEKAIQQLQFRPSKVARSLKTKKTFQIGLMIPDITNPYFAEIARGVESIALQNSYQLFLCNTDGVVQREEKTLQSFWEQHVDGIINVAPRMDMDLVFAFSQRIPTVILDREPSEKDGKVDAVFINNYQGSFELAVYLANQGHHQFACIRGPQEVPSSSIRVKGFTEGLHSAGIPRSRLVVIPGDFSFARGFEGMKEILYRQPHPSAVFCCNDLMAWGAMEAAKQAGLRIPEGIAIAGFDNVYFTEFLVPTLTTIHQPKFDAGQIAMKTMLERIQTGAGGWDPRRIELSTQLILRKSA